MNFESISPIITYEIFENDRCILHSFDVIGEGFIFKRLAQNIVFNSRRLKSYAYFFLITNYNNYFRSTTFKALNDSILLFIFIFFLTEKSTNVFCFENKKIKKPSNLEITAKTGQSKTIIAVYASFRGMGANSTSKLKIGKFSKSPERNDYYQR